MFQKAVHQSSGSTLLRLTETLFVLDLSSSLQDGCAEQLGFYVSLFMFEGWYDVEERASADKHKAQILSITLIGQSLHCPHPKPIPETKDLWHWLA